MSIFHKIGSAAFNGHYEYVRMSFELKNGPTTFQLVMDVLFGLQEYKNFMTSQKE